MILAGMRPRSLTFRPCFFAQDRIAAAWSRSIAAVPLARERPELCRPADVRPAFRAAPTYFARPSRRPFALLFDRSISYAVFCLKKKNEKEQETNTKERNHNK